MLQVAEILNVSKYMVGRVRTRRCASLNVLKGGRPKLLSQADERFCVRQATIKAVKSASKFSKLLETNAGTEVSPETVRRTLRRRGWERLLNLKNLCCPRLTSRSA